jgi:hypothetical protein
MEREDHLELIHQQILDTRAQLECQGARGEKTDGTRALLRSLRLSLHAITAGIDPGEQSGTSFVLSVSGEGEVSLRRERHLVVLSGPSFRSLLQSARVSLVPGQVLLIEPALARWAIEDTLAEMVAEEFGLEKRRAELLAALAQSSDTVQERLLAKLRQLDAREADLLDAKIHLGGLNQAAGLLLGHESSGC